jgi:hypothetical protein
LNLSIWVVAADMASPQYRRAEISHVVQEPGSLRVMQYDYIPRPNYLANRFGIILQNPLIDCPFTLPQETAIARRTVYPIVHTLRNGEEIRSSLNYQPPCVDVNSSGVSQQNLHHFGHPTARRGGVDVENPAGCQCLTRFFRQGL